MISLILSRQQAAEILGCSTWTISQLIKRGTLRASALAADGQRTRRIPLRSVLDYAVAESLITEERAEKMFEAAAEAAQAHLVEVIS